MKREIKTLGAESLSLYATIPIAYEVSSYFHVSPREGGLGGISMEEKRLETPYRKDYDNIGAVNTGPLTWARDFDLTRWGVLIAFEGELPIGGATVAFATPGVNMLEGRDDIAVLWDLRVRPEARRGRVGAALFQAAVDWSLDRGCEFLKIETQNTNVPACRFYQKQGCTLGSIHRLGYRSYPAVAHETLLLWYKDLQSKDNL